MWHFALIVASWSCLSTVMNLSVILFLQEATGSLFFAGLALSIGSVAALFFDGPFALLQKKYESRTLFLAAIVGTVFSVFLFLIGTKSIFFGFLAAICFRVSFDLSDITAISYILARSLPAEYGQSLSYKQTSQGVGMIFGFLISAILLSAAYFLGDATSSIIKSVSSEPEKSSQFFFSALFFIKIFLLLLLGGLFFFAFFLYDRDQKLPGKKEIFTSIQELEAGTVRELKKRMFRIIRNSPKEEKSSSDHIELKTTEEKESLHFSEIFLEMIHNIMTLIFVFRKTPKNTPLLWSIGIVGLFSYWDTFLGTFLPVFFTEALQEQEGWVSHVPGSLLMLFFILPVLVFLPLIAKLADKYGRYPFMLLGLLLTAGSVFLVGAVPYSVFSLLLVGGFGISFGYLFAMGSARAQTAENMNEFLAIEKNETKIDSNASAGPTMLVDNLGNIIGPVLGGGMIQLLGFRGFFILFGILLMFFSWYSLRRFSDISGFSYIFQSPIRKVKGVLQS
ncbi:MFS transporter [Candidatus Peregrinibacteria bacterium]|nr:MAG: MFS transporter [Candidatus Peregrinibacteria bacterium]